MNHAPQERCNRKLVSKQQPGDSLLSDGLSDSGAKLLAPFFRISRNSELKLQRFKINLCQLRLVKIPPVVKNVKK